MCRTSLTNKQTSFTNSTVLYSFLTQPGSSQSELNLTDDQSSAIFQTKPKFLEAASAGGYQTSTPGITFCHISRVVLDKSPTNEVAPITRCTGRGVPTLRKRAEVRREKSRVAAQVRRNRESQVLVMLQNALPIASIPPSMEKSSIIRVASNTLCLYNAFQKFLAARTPPTLSMWSQALIAIVLDADRHIVYAPPALGEITGAQWTSLIGIPVQEVIEGATTPEVDRIVRLKVTGNRGRSYNGTGTVLATCWMSASSSEDVDSDPLTVCLLQPITSMGDKDDTEEVAKLEPARPEQTRYVFRTFHDKDLKISDMDANAFHCTGFELQDLVGKTIYDLVHLDDVEQLKVALDALETQEVVTTKCYRLRTKLGEFRWTKTILCKSEPKHPYVCKHEILHFFYAAESCEHVEEFEDNQLKTSSLYPLIQEYLPLVDSNEEEEEASGYPDFNFTCEVAPSSQSDWLCSMDFEPLVDDGLILPDRCDLENDVKATSEGFGICDHDEVELDHQGRRAPKIDMSCQRPFSEEFIDPDMLFNMEPYPCEPVNCDTKPQVMCQATYSNGPPNRSIFRPGVEAILGTIKQEICEDTGYSGESRKRHWPHETPECLTMRTPWCRQMSKCSRIENTPILKAVLTSIVGPRKTPYMLSDSIYGKPGYGGL